MAETVQLTINGMTCDHCVAAVTGALKGIAGVKEATVSLDEKSAVVIGESLDARALVVAIEDEGYEATPV
jgi:copper chaperone